jgi:hypothetical protein
LLIGLKNNEKPQNIKINVYSSTDSSQFLILWAQVIFFSLLTICMIYTIYSTVRFIYNLCTRNRQQTRVQTLEVEMNGEVLQQAIEHKLGSKFYKDLKDQKNYESQCVICLEQFEEET